VIQPPVVPLLLRRPATHAPVGESGLPQRIEIHNNGLTSSAGALGRIVSRTKQRAYVVRAFPRAGRAPDQTVFSVDWQRFVHKAANRIKRLFRFKMDPIPQSCATGSNGVSSWKAEQSHDGTHRIKRLFANLKRSPSAPFDRRIKRCFLDRLRAHHNVPHRTKRCFLGGGPRMHRNATARRINPGRR
jgi:hypothetical protein